MSVSSKIIGCACLAGATALLTSCGSTGVGGLYGGATRSSDQPRPATPFNMAGYNPQTMMERQRFLQDMQANPDLPAWQQQREKMALAVGDRIVDKSFDRTFDSMIIALANIGCRVNNMERTSGYITSSLPELPPEQKSQLNKEAMAQYAQVKGYSPAVLDDKSGFNIALPGAMAEKMTAGITLTITRQGAQQTKVKLRFNNVYYPPEIDALYKRVWEAVDKQIFLDKTLG